MNGRKDFPKSIEEQVEILRGLFPELGDATYNKTIAQQPLPEHAEGWFAIPSIDALAAKYFPEVTDSDQKYCQAVQLVLDKIAISRLFFNYYEDEITPDYLHQHPRTLKAFSKLTKVQKGYDILIIAVQLGSLHQGCSVSQAREDFMPNEFGLGIFAVGIILLTHPDRFVSWLEWDNLHIDCPGDEIFPEANWFFPDAPCFVFGDGIELNSRCVGDDLESFGSASAFLPQ